MTQGAGPLAADLRACGPVLDTAAADRTHDVLVKAAEAGGWTDLLVQAWPALRPVCGASAYLAGLARRRPERLAWLLGAAPAARLADILAAVDSLTVMPPDPPVLSRRLRELKADIHLLCALADLGGVWDLDAVTGALTRFADAAVSAAVAGAARVEVERGRLVATDGGAHGPVPGFFCIAMGKHGAFELNYSSDIDISVFFEPGVLPLTAGVEAQAFAVRLTQSIAETLQARTADGYVFRVDLRLRPDPSSTAPAVSVPAALEYYETVGQNWERAAFIKARACGGDLPRAEAFLAELQPFIWRRNLDFAAIADIHSIKRQIHIHKVDERLEAKGADLKLGHGGIREIEFFVQTQQLILGGRNPGLRSRRTLDALEALMSAGVVSRGAAHDLAPAYADLRALEHRAQMIADEQTHKLPESDDDRRRIAALWGERDLRRFDNRVGRLLRRVNARYGELFPDDEDLSSTFGSLVFTGVDDDPETLKTLARMGFAQPKGISSTIRAWHHGRIAATRTERSRELLTRLAPRLLEASQATGAPDVAFSRFGDFFAGLSSGVQVQSLLLAQPRLLTLIVRVMAFAPRLAQTLARRPAALDALLDQAFFARLEPGEARAALSAALALEPPGFEPAMDAARRVQREQTLRIGVRVMSGEASAAEAGPAFTELAEACIRALGPAALAETERLGGAFPGEVAVVALGKCGSGEMTASSDLDLMTVYQAAEPASASAGKGWAAETFYARFTQRLIAALSAPTAEGGLDDVDMRLRPSGTAGPVAVSMAAFTDYYAKGAETGEFLALTRARVVWASASAFGTMVTAGLEHALRQARAPKAVARDTREMRELMARERPAGGFWDLKLMPGGLVDIEFAAQCLQLLHAASGGPLRANTSAALVALRDAKLAPLARLDALLEAWRLQQDLAQLIKLALGDEADPASEPAALRALMAQAGQVKTFTQLQQRLRKARAAARKAYEAVVTG